MAVTPRARRPSLRSRWAAVGAGVLAVSVLGIAVAGDRVREWQRAVEARSDARLARSEVAELRGAIATQSTSVRAVLVGGETDVMSFHDTYREGVAIERTMIARLSDHQVVVGADEIRSRAGVLSAEAEGWRTTVAQPVLERTAAITVDEFDAASDALLRQMDALDVVVTMHLERAVDRAADLEQQTNAVLLACAIAAVGGIAVVAILFGRWVTQPLSAIGVAARRMVDDDTSAWPDAATSELQDVTDAVHTLQATLVQERDRAVTAYRGLEQSAILALSVRSELANQLGSPPEGWVIDSALVPAEGVVAGDCYDAGLLDQRHLYVVVIDVTGHGAHAALDALKAKSQLRAALRSGLAPGDAIAWLARENERDDDIDVMTAVVAVIETTTGTCDYAVAGHPVPIVTDGTSVRVLERTGPLIGAFTSTWGTSRTVIEPGSLLVLYTDGVTEAIGAERERFGHDRLVSAALGPRVRTASDAVASVLTAVDEFRTVVRSDDVTVLAIQHTSPVLVDHPDRPLAPPGDELHLPDPVRAPTDRVHT